MGSRDIKARLLRRAGRADISLRDDLVAGLAAYFDLLERWNRKINLTSLDDLDRAVDRLLLEPVIAARHVPPSASRQLDVGSGGGSPAIPMKLALPALHLRMVEVKARKAAFLREATRQLRLSNTSVETSRYEELLAHPELHEAADIVSVRAVRLETRLLTTLQAFLAVGGVLMLFRGPSGPEEPDSVIPPLKWAGTYPLVQSLQSRLTLLTKIKG